jgi:sialate O-acetylesterase
MKRVSAAGKVPAARRMSDSRTRMGVTRVATVCGCVVAALVSVATACARNESPGADSLRLPKLFADGMVLQRETPVPVWGWATPGATVTVTLGGETARSAANADGGWAVTLPAMRAGGPHEMTVESNGTRVQIRDILAGDVWVASGQSNMEWPVDLANNAAAEVAAANDPHIRHFEVANSWSEAPADDLDGGSWAAADPQNVGEFSAVGYFFARELRKSIDVPIGLVNASWGGSNIETWLSREALGLSDSAWAEIVTLERERTAAIRDSLVVRLGTLPTVDGGLVEGRAVWADPELDDASWADIGVPSLWESAGYPGMDGVAWYRLAFTLTPDDAKQPARLSLGSIDDDDITWLNGTEVGRTNGYATLREYAIPASLLRAGRNVLAVRVSDGAGGGGIYGNPARLSLELGGVRRALAGTWKFKVGEVSLGDDGQRVNKIPTALYNRMVHPLQRYPIKGVLWYQGESNANSVEQAAEYRALFAKLITSWRREWVGVDDFPFLWVQLPNVNAPDSAPPARTAWATQRESMTAALTLPNTGQAVTIDVGDAHELHPRNKQDVGARLALVARRVAYGQPVVASGPTYRRHTVRDGRVWIEFDNISGGLTSRAPDGTVGGFAIAGSDRKLVWAHARIEGDRVVVWSDRVPIPVAVRYAWADNPSTANLYNREGLPAAPFRTDSWQ